ncbi:hypothetical protein FNF29_02672 [Cafeteria roenbergensis]|uniref:Sulfhydryl oxidase n=1 Tax=Cafeteria roenbergensis TaxID=33653 RepID=A0A5A8CMR6_CAFRO|nr:hypothetical protein FNF29_02672 [Cafeteria roenbergensis]|eukprot:KAA0154049.1 hypothetical protein FNF29_02672 [Cafeteria roenbergensis]
MVCATHPDEFDAVERMAGLHDTGSGSIMVLVSLGVHPFRAADVSAPPPSGAEAEAAWVADVRNRIERSGRRIGIGECGLDRSPSGLARCPMDVQLAVFEAQVALAAELGLPLTVHCVRAVAHVATALRRHAPLRAPVVLHSWAGKPGALGELTALGCVPSFSGAVCNPAFKAARSSAAACAQDALLAETDSPDQLPVCMRDSRMPVGRSSAARAVEKADQRRVWLWVSGGVVCVVLLLVVVSRSFSRGVAMRGLAQQPPHPPSRQELGNAGWLLLHKIATTFEDDPSPAEQARLRRFLDDWSYLYPCSECAGHFQALLRENPPDTSSRLAFMAWLCQAHNTVNKRLGKELFPCDVEALEGRWGGCGCAEKSAG